MPNLVPFEEVEAIILLNVCQFILSCDLGKNSMLLCLSKILRDLAKNKGYDIDASYRSPSGLSHQTNVMLNYISDSGGNNVPKVFAAATDLYEYDNNEFRRKLWDGLVMSSDNDKQAFLRFLTLQKPQSASEIFWSLEKAEEHLITHGSLKGTLYGEMSSYSIDNFETIIMNDAHFLNKHNKMIRFLKTGFSVMKEYAASDNVSGQINTAISVPITDEIRSISGSQFSPNIVEQCLNLIKENFPNGIKKGSGIAKRKFLSAYSGKYDANFPYDTDFDNLLSQITLEYADKYYAIDNNLIDFIHKQLSDCPVDSEMLFFYSAFYDSYIGKLSQLGIYSEEMLKAVLKKEFPNYFYSTNYFAARRELTIEQVVNSAYREDICLSPNELKERLPFIESKQILYVLSKSNSGFVRMADGRYAMKKRVKIVPSDVEQSRIVINNDLHTQGYSFTTSLIVEDSEYENPEISKSALQLILFDNYLSNDYSRNRTLIAAFGEAVSITKVLKSFCKQHRRITLKEIEEYEIELTGEDKAQRSLNAAVSSMIRVDKELFIDHMDFDIKAVDKAIEPFIDSRKIISLNNVTSFSAFPDVERYAWSSYLLASYLRRYSERWGYMGDETKKKSVGAIYDKKLNFDSYDDALAQAVASSGVELTQEDVSYFLLHNEYRLRNMDFRDIISKAYQIRMREE